MRAAAARQGAWGQVRDPASAPQGTGFDAVKPYCVTVCDPDLNYHVLEKGVFMAGCPIIRFDKLKTSAEIVGRAGHHLRTIPVKNADADRTPDNQVLMGLDVPKAIGKRALETTKDLVKRKDNVRCVEVFLGASDDFWDAGGDWIELAKAHKKMLIAEFGEKNIVAMGWHLDEGRPHGWAFVTPITPDGRLSAAHWLDGPSKLKQMLTRVQPFFEPLGMERAKEGVRANHIEMHQVHAANDGNKRAKKQLDDELAERVQNAVKLTQLSEQKALSAQAELNILEVRKTTEKEALQVARKKLEAVAQALNERAVQLDAREAENAEARTRLQRWAEQLQARQAQLAEAVGLVIDKLPTAWVQKLANLFQVKTPQEPTPSIQAPDAAAGAQKAPGSPFPGSGGAFKPSSTTQSHQKGPKGP